MGKPFDGRRDARPTINPPKVPFPREIDIIRGFVWNGSGLPLLQRMDAPSGAELSCFSGSLDHPPSAAEQEEDAGGPGFGFGHREDVVAGDAA